MRIRGITLLDETEFKFCKDIIPKKDCYWWLRTKYNGSEYEAIIVEHYRDWDKIGDLKLNGVDDGSTGVAPALICDHHLPRGSKVRFAGHRWTVISECMIFCDDIIGKCKFNDLETWHDFGSGNDYDNSTVKAYVEDWLKEHKDDHMSLVEEHHVGWVSHLKNTITRALNKASSKEVINSRWEDPRKRIDDLLCDVNPNEIASQIASDNLSGWISRWKEAMNQALDEAFATGGDTHDASL